MSKTSIPDKVKNRLWARSAGRCEFPGCNRILYRDDLTRNEYNISYIGHIIADSPKGPRGDGELSSEQAKEFDNLMLLCDEHHRLIDGDHRGKYSTETLKGYKKRHEDRIERITGIQEGMKTHILLYGIDVGRQSSPLTMEKAQLAVVENGFYPAKAEPLEMGLKNSAFTDDQDEYWILQKKNLEELYHQKLRFRIKDGNIPHLSIFGFAPQPLLIYLGHLLSDIPSAELYQLHRTPPNWIWKESSSGEKCRLIKSDKKATDIALAVSLSQRVAPLKIKEVMGKSIPIWNIMIDEPYNEFLKTKQQLADFRILYKKALDEIKHINGTEARIHLFPAAPVTVAIEMGRARMPKVDLPMTIYDYNKTRGGFIKTIEID